MSKLFTYSVLKYIHSQFLGEELNLGIIFYFPDDRKLIFRHPANIHRLKKAYKDFTEQKIKTYLKSFEKKANELTRSNVSGKLEEVIQASFLVRDASTLQFDKVQSVVRYTSDIEAIVDHYFSLYFPEEGQSNLLPLHPEPAIYIPSIILQEHFKFRSDREIAADYKKLLLEKDSNLKKCLQKGIELRNSRTHFKSDFTWQNGTLNAVKGVSFELKDEAAILDKALLLTAQLNYLRLEAERENIRFDLLVSAPKIEELTDAYENALKTLGDITVKKKIIREIDLADYANLTTVEIERHPKRLN